MTRSAGNSVIRTDARAKVTGEALYAVDITKPDMLIGVVLRSERAHANIVDIDVSEAMAVPGVEAVITAADLNGLFPRFGHIVADHPILAIDRVRYYGEPVALVLATTAHVATDGARQVRVTYEDLPTVMSIDDALDPDAPLLHEHGYDPGDQSFEEAMSETTTPTNVAHNAALEWGDVDSAFAEAHLVVETRTTYPMLYAYAMEPYNAIADFENGVLEVTTTAQHPYQVREDLARIFDLPLAGVRVLSPYLGGGYGSKSYTKVEPLAAVGAWYANRPVKLALDVEEAIYTTRADGGVVSVKSAFAADGTITAREFHIDLDSGAYADNSPLVLAKAVHRCFGPYRIPNLRVLGRSFYTNTTPASSYRGFGAPQGNLAGELNMDQAADKLGIEGATIRHRNLLKPGETVLPGARPLDADLPADLDMVLDSLDASRPRERLSGIGFGASVSDAGAFPVSTATVRLLADGSVLLLTGATEMGQGSRTALTQIAATELGIPMESIRIVQSDTGVTPYERTTGASRTTTLTGLAIQRACAEVASKLIEMVAETREIPAEDIKTSDGVVSVPGSDDLTFAEAVQEWFGSKAGEVTGIGIVRKADTTAILPPFWEVGMVGVEVSIDEETGYVTVERLATVGDVGYAINPALVEGQDLGAATQGLGAALYEQLIYDGGQPLNPNVVDYRVPHIRDIPIVIDTMLAERRDGVGPYGAKGSGEGALNPIGGAVASAIGRAVGVWPDQLPLTPERVLAASQIGTIRTGVELKSRSASRIDNPDGGQPSFLSLWPIFLAGPIVLSGLQSLLPALPIMQIELGLTDSQVGLVTSAYLLPGVLLAIPAGILADRFGRRIMLSGSLLLFGLGAVVILSAPDLFWLFIVVRVGQGAAFAAVLAVTITIIGDTYRGPTQVTGQGIRSLALKIGDAGLPILGGALASVSWYAPIWTQLIAIPVGIVTWLMVDDSGMCASRDGATTRSALATAKNLPVATLLTAGFFRFFFKFTFLTYVPLLAVRAGALSVLEVGALLGIAALSAAITGPLAGIVTRYMRPSTAIGVAVATIGTAFVVISIETTPIILWVSAVSFGTADGLFGVVQTSLTTQIPAHEIRATFVGLAATLRNLGKFAAPTVLGALVLAVSIATSFTIVGIVALLAVTLVIPLRSLDVDVIAAPPKLT